MSEKHPFDTPIKFLLILSLVASITEHFVDHPVKVIKETTIIKQETIPVVVPAAFDSAHRWAPGGEFDASHRRMLYDTSGKYPGPAVTVEQAAAMGGMITGDPSHGPMPIEEYERWQAK